MLIERQLHYETLRNQTALSIHQRHLEFRLPTNTGNGGYRRDDPHSFNCRRLCVRYAFVGWLVGREYQQTNAVASSHMPNGVRQRTRRAYISWSSVANDHQD